MSAVSSTKNGAKAKMDKHALIRILMVPSRRSQLRQTPTYRYHGRGDELPYQALRDYYHKWYRPDLQGLIIVGDVDVDRIEKKIKEIRPTSSLMKKVAERVYHEVPDHDEPISIIATDPEHIHDYLYHGAQ